METIEEYRRAPIKEYIYDRVYNKNNSFTMIFVGPTGSGKSYAALSFGKMLDPTFSIDRVAFKALDFMRIVNNLCKDETSGTKGKVVMWDEFGVEHNAREFMTQANRMINFFFQTTRHRNMIMFMTVPYLSFIDGATRKLCHAIAEMQYINPHTLKGERKNMTSEELIQSIKSQYPQKFNSRQTKPFVKEIVSEDLLTFKDDSPLERVKKDKTADTSFKKGEISLCKRCNCMTKSIRGSIGIRRCGKCGDFK